VTVRSASEYARERQAKLPWVVDRIDERGEFVVYYGHYTRSGVSHRVLVAYRLLGPSGFQLIADATEGVFPMVEADVGKFIRSLREEHDAK
jgi:hypothetical protein